MDRTVFRRRWPSRLAARVGLDELAGRRRLEYRADRRDDGQRPEQLLDRRAGDRRHAVLPPGHRRLLPERELGLTAAAVLALVVAHGGFWQRLPDLRLRQRYHLRRRLRWRLRGRDAFRPDRGIQLLAIGSGYRTDRALRCVRNLVRRDALHLLLVRSAPIGRHLSARLGNHTRLHLSGGRDEVRDADRHRFGGENLERRAQRRCEHPPDSDARAGQHRAAVDQRHRPAGTGAEYIQWLVDQRRHRCGLCLAGLQLLGEFVQHDLRSGVGELHADHGRRGPHCAFRGDG